MIIMPLPSCAEYIMKQCAKTWNNVGPNISSNLLPIIFKYLKQCAKNMKQTCAEYIMKQCAKPWNNVGPNTWWDNVQKHETMWGWIYHQTYCLLYSNIWNKVQKTWNKPAYWKFRHYVTWMRWTLKTRMNYREEGWVKGGNSNRVLE